MDAYLCDELLQEIFRRLDPLACSAASLVSKRWYYLTRISQTSISITIYPRYPSLYTLPSLCSFLSHRSSLSSLSLCAATLRFSPDDLLLGVASSCPNLQNLRLSTRRVSLRSLLSLSTSCPLLSSLTITLSRPLSFKWLYSFPSLQHLSVVCSSEIISHNDFATADVINPDAQLNLVSLTISGAREKDHAINWLWAKCPNLNKLKLKNCDIPKDAPFSGFNALQQVQFKRCGSFADSALSQLALTCTSLKNLSVEGCSKQGLLHFITRNNCTLQKLDLRSFNQLDDTHLSAIAQKMMGLSSLRIQKPHLVTGQGLKNLAVALGDDIEELALMNCKHVIKKEPGLLATLGQHFPRLTKLDLSCNKKLEDKELITMLVTCVYLVDLKLKCCRRLTNAIAESVIKNCKYLESVDIMECSEIGIQGVELFVKNCPRLRRIHVEEHKLSDVGRTWASDKFIEVVVKGGKVRPWQIDYV